MPLHAALLPLLLLITPLRTLPAAFQPPPILMYHRVDVDRPADPVGRELTVTPDQFREQLAYLKAHSITVISMAQMERRLENGEPLESTVVLTFDDGYADQYSYALPLLRASGASATFYIVTGEVGRHGHLTWAQIRTMASLHMDMAAHGVAHADLSHMTPMQQTYQINRSVSTLQRLTGEPVESYAYPSGRFNRATLHAVRGSGVSLAVTTDPKYVLPPENRFEITRVRVRGSWSLDQFAAAIRAAARRLHVVVR